MLSNPNDYRYSPRPQSGKKLPTNVREVSDYTPFVVHDAKYPSFYIMYNGSWAKQNITPYDDLRIKKIGVGLGEGESINYDITLKDGGTFSHNAYTKGELRFDGRGYYLDYNKTYSNKSYMVVDNFLVRGRMDVFELQIIQKRFTNGSLFIGNGAKVEGVYGTTIVLQDPNNRNVCPFIAGDLLLVKRVDLDSTTVLRSVEATVATVSGRVITVTYESGSDEFVAGDEVVRVGNTTDTNRQGLVYLTADDEYAPYISIMNEVSSWTIWHGMTKEKARFGRLDGKTTTQFGALSGYGAWYENSLYIEDGFIALNSGGYIRAGKTSHTDTTAGFWLGTVSTVSKFHVGNATNYVNWNGTTLDVKGTITITNLASFANGAALSLDDVTDGSTFGRVLTTSIQSGKIKLTEALGTLDDVDDGSYYAKIASTDVSAGHITLVSSSASININSTIFGNSGIQLQYNSGNPRMYIGNGSTIYMQYSGGALSLGGGTITGGTIQTATSGQRIIMAGATNDIKFYDATSGGYASIEPYYTAVGSIPSLKINSDYTYFASKTVGSSANVQIFPSTSSTGTTGIWLEGYAADRQAYLTLNSTSGAALLGQLVMIDNTDYNSATINFYKTYLQFSDGLLLGGDKFSINATGQITKINNVVTSGYVPISNGTHYEPRALTATDVTNAVSTGGSYSNPSWITSLAYSKLSSVPTASSSVSGILSSTDWSTFNGKQNAITTTNTATGGTPPASGDGNNGDSFRDSTTGYIWLKIAGAWYRVN